MQPHRLSLIQKVSLALILLFAVTCTSIGLLISVIIRRSHLDSQKQNTAQFVQKQARQYLTEDDFQSPDFANNQEKFRIFRDNISFPDIVRIKIYNPQGVVISSDQPELIGQKLFETGDEELGDILQGKVVAEIAQPSRPENVYEKQFPELLEIYVPITYDDTNVVGVVETYLQLTILNSQIAQSQLYAILIITAITLLIFVILFFTVHTASQTLIQQDRQLKKDIEKEKEYSAIKDEFITLSSHQLRTPASIIKWSLESLDDPTLRHKMTAQQISALTTASDNLEALISIINNILIVSGLKADYFTFEDKDYPLVDLVDPIIEKYHQLIVDKQLKITLSPSSKNLPLHINQKRAAINTALDVLLKNAIDYTPPKGNITLEIIPFPHKFQLKVADAGIGIPKEERPKVFDRFFRASNSIQQKNFGSGLSLYIAQRIADGYSGTLTYTALPQGSLFTLEIPLQKGQ